MWSRVCYIVVGVGNLLMGEHVLSGGLKERVEITPEKPITISLAPERNSHVVCPASSLLAAPPSHLPIREVMEEITTQGTHGPGHSAVQGT